VKMSDLYKKWVNNLAKELRMRDAYNVEVVFRNEHSINLTFRCCNRSDFESRCWIMLYFNEPKKAYITAYTVNGKIDTEIVINDTAEIVKYFDYNDILKSKV